MRLVLTAMDALNILEAGCSIAVAHFSAAYLLGAPPHNAITAAILLLPLQLLHWRRDAAPLHAQPQIAAAIAALLAPALAASVFGGVWAGVRLQQGLRPALGLRRAAVLAASAAALGWLSPWRPHLQLALRFWLLLTAHAGACAAACGWRDRTLRIGAFAEEVCIALARTAPLYPVLVVAASTALLVVTSVACRLLRSGNALEILHSLSWVAVHAPFWVVFALARRGYARRGRTTGGRTLSEPPV